LPRRAISGIVSAASPFSAAIAAVASTIRSRWLRTISARGSSLGPLGSGLAARMPTVAVGPSLEATRPSGRRAG